MEHTNGNFKIQYTDSDTVFVVLGDAWLEIENRNGNLAVTAYHTWNPDGQEVCEIDGRFGTVSLGGE